MPSSTTSESSSSSARFVRPLSLLPSSRLEEQLGALHREFVAPGAERGGVRGRVVEKYLVEKRSAIKTNFFISSSASSFYSSSCSFFLLFSILFLRERASLSDTESGKSKERVIYFQS